MNTTGCGQIPLHTHEKKKKRIKVNKAFYSTIKANILTEVHYDNGLVSKFRNKSINTSMFNLSHSKDGALMSLGWFVCYHVVGKILSKCVVLDWDNFEQYLQKWDFCSEKCYIGY